MAGKVVGVDIGSRSIRAVEVRNSSAAHPIVAKMHEVALPDGAVRAGEVIEVGTVTGALRALWAEAKFSTKDVVLGVSGATVHPRDASFPKAPMHRIREMLPFTVQDLIPLPVAEAILDFYPASESVTEEGPVVRGILVAASKDAMKSMISAVLAAKLNPVAVDLQPFGLVRALDPLGENPMTTVIVEIGTSSTSIIVSESGVPQFVRTLPIGDDDVTTALAKRLGVSSLQAAHVKRTYGLIASRAGAEERPVIEAVYAASWDLLVGIRDTLSYYSASHAGVVLGRLVLLGEGAATPGLDQLIGDATRIAVQRPDFSGLASLAKGAEQPTGGIAEFWVAPLGLAMGAVA
jgi:type IV pilus assembly protein PilM